MRWACRPRSSGPSRRQSRRHAVVGRDPAALDAMAQYHRETGDFASLATTLEARADTTAVGRLFGVNPGADGFFLEAHHKLRGVETNRHGIFLAGAALGPKDIHESTMEALAAASKVATFLGRGVKSVSPEVAYLIPGRCDLCGICVDQCPSQAIEKGKNEIIINPISCNGCSICIPICPKEALDLRNTTEEQMIAQIKGIFENEGIQPKRTHIH